MAFPYQAFLSGWNKYWHLHPLDLKKTHDIPLRPQFPIFHGVTSALTYDTLVPDTTEMESNEWLRTDLERSANTLSPSNPIIPKSPKSPKFLLEAESSRFAARFKKTEQVPAMFHLYLLNNPLHCKDLHAELPQALREKKTGSDRFQKLSEQYYKVWNQVRKLGDESLSLKATDIKRKWYEDADRDYVSWQQHKDVGVPENEVRHLGSDWTKDSSSVDCRQLADSDKADLQAYFIHACKQSPKIKRRVGQIPLFDYDHLQTTNFRLHYEILLRNNLNRKPSREDPQEGRIERILKDDSGSDENAERLKDQNELLEQYSKIMAYEDNLLTLFCLRAEANQESADESMGASWQYVKERREMFATHWGLRAWFQWPEKDADAYYELVLDAKKKLNGHLEENGFAISNCLTGYSWAEGLIPRYRNDRRAGDTQHLPTREEILSAKPALSPIGGSEASPTVERLREV